MSKKIYKDIQDSVYRYIDMETSIDSLISELISIRDDIRNMGATGEITLEGGSSCYECGGCHEDYEIKFTRKETDKERDKRLATARKEREKKKELKDEIVRKERELYENLKKKFE